MQGLAGQGQAQESMDSVKEIAAMLMNGVKPEELLAKGVPEELINAAMQLITQQQQPQVPQDGGPVGLAGMATQGMM